MKLTQAEGEERRTKAPSKPPVCDCGQLAPISGGWVDNKVMCASCFDAWLAKARPAGVEVKP